MLAKSALAQLLPTPSSTLSITNTNVLAYTVFKRAVKLIHWILLLNEQKPFKLEKKEVLISILERLKQSTDDRVFINAGKEIPRYLL